MRFFKTFRIISDYIIISFGIIVENKKKKSSNFKFANP